MEYDANDAEEEVRRSSNSNRRCVYMVLCSWEAGGVDREKKETAKKEKLKE